MLDWKIFAIIGPLFYASFQALTKLLPKGTSVFLVNAYAALVGFVFMITLHLLLSPNKSLALNGKSIPIAIGIGLFLGLGNFSVIKAYSLGAPQSIFSIIAYVVLIIYGIVFGLLLFHEKLSIPQLFGALLSIVGILIIVYYRR